MNGKAERLAGWEVPHLHVDKPGGTTGEPDRPGNPGFQCREIKPQPLTENTCGGLQLWEKLPLHREGRWRDPQGPRMYTKPPTGELAPEGPNLLVDSRGSD